MYLEDRVSDKALCIARAAGWEPIPVPFIPPPNGGYGVFYRYHDQYTKLNLWSLDELGVEQAVYLDADTLVLRNFEELFDIPFNFAAVPDVYTDSRGFTVPFNAGILVLRPSTAVLKQMKIHVGTAAYPPTDAEQGFLNLFFAANAVRLPYAYNANVAIKYKSPAVWEGIKREIRIVHYTLEKPFLDSGPGSNAILTEERLLQVINDVSKRRGGLLAEEVKWWHEAYNETMSNKRAQFEAC